MRLDQSYGSAAYAAVMGLKLYVWEIIAKPGYLGYRFPKFPAHGLELETEYLSELNPTMVSICR